MLRKLLKGLVLHQSQQWHEKRVQLFLTVLRSATWPIRSIVDLGGGNGAYMAAYAHLLPGIEIIVADIDEVALAEAHSRYGFKTVKLLEQEPLPFRDTEWDLIFCNSVIEHVTIPKNKVWDVMDDNDFLSRARKQQAMFAAEIGRTARGYFVQTPHRAFPIESHTWLPFVQYLPRRLLIPVLRNTNRWWLKRTAPDWHLLDRKEMEAIFPDAKVITERVLGMPKSLIAFRTL